MHTAEVLLDSCLLLPEEKCLWRGNAVRQSEGLKQCLWGLHICGAAQGLGDVMLVHKSKLQKDKEAALAKRAAAGTQADKPLPSYMRATASFNAATVRMATHSRSPERKHL